MADTETEFPSYPEPEEFDPKAERQKIRSEERDEAERKWNVSQARWARFRYTCYILAATVALSALGWAAVTAIYSNHVWNTARTAWTTQCRIEGGTPVRDIDLKDGPILCVIDSKVVRVNG